MDIQHISVSRKNTFETCEVQYKYKYHLKMVADGPEPVHFTYGKTVHKIAEEYVRGQGNISIDEIAKSVLNGEILLEENKKASPLTDYYKPLFPNHVANIKKITDKIGFDGFLEYKFNYDLDPPHNKMTIGFIDRLIVKNNKYFILDYKTTKVGKWRKTPETIKKDVQLRFYAKVVQKYFNAEAENIHAALYYLEGGNLVSAKFTQSQIDETEKELLSTYNQIVETNPDNAHGTVGFHCRWCDYNAICPWYNQKK